MWILPISILSFGRSGDFSINTYRLSTLIHYKFEELMGRLRRFYQLTVGGIDQPWSVLGYNAN